MSLFYFFGCDGTNRAGQGGGYMPRRWRPLPTPAHPDGLHIAGSRTGRAITSAGNQGRPRKARHTRPDAGHAAPVCTRYQTVRAGRSGWHRGPDGWQCVRNCADTDAHKPPYIKSHFCDVLLPVQRFCPLQSHTSVIL